MREVFTDAIVVIMKRSSVPTEMKNVTSVTCLDT